MGFVEQLIGYADNELAADSFIQLDLWDLFNFVLSPVSGAPKRSFFFNIKKGVDIIFSV